MDDRAVEALVVVLDDDLPVRLDLVDDAHADAELVHPEAIERRHALDAVVQRLEQRPRLASEAREQESRVRVDREAVERVAALGRSARPP